MNSFFTSLANVFGPIIGGWMFDLDINYPFYFAAVVIVAGLVIAFAWKDPQAVKNNA